MNDNLKYKFEEMFPESYVSLKKIVSRLILDGKTILDVGAGEGAVARVIDKNRTDCQVVCLEPNTAAYNRLMSKTLKNNSLIGKNVDIKHYLDSPHKVSADITIFHRSLHHIAMPLKELFKALSGTLIIGDPYFPPEVSEEEFNLEMEELQRKSGHSHKLKDYHNPNQVVASAIDQGFELQYFEIQPEGEREKMYYQIVLEKKKSS